MDYISAVESAVRDVDTHRVDLSAVHRGLELVLAGWQLHVAATGPEWDLLGTAVQTVAEDFDDQAPIVYTVETVGDAVVDWRHTVRLVRAIAARLDRFAGAVSTDPAGSWWAATAAARLRAAAPVSS
jgi:hypothetical protein